MRAWNTFDEQTLRPDFGGPDHGPASEPSARNVAHRDALVGRHPSRRHCFATVVQHQTVIPGERQAINVPEIFDTGARKAETHDLRFLGSSLNPST